MLQVVLIKMALFRNINTKEITKILQEIDLYKTLIDGDIHFDHQLRNGDVVIVNQAKRHISISVVCLFQLFMNLEKM